jgi:recombination protein RecT
MTIANTTTFRTALPDPGMAGMTWRETESKALSTVRTYLMDQRGGFAEIMGSRESQAFIASVMLAVASQPKLWVCSLESIYICAMRVAILGLSVDPAIGEACIIPYKNHGKDEAQMITMWKGYRTLAMNTGRYKNIFASRLFDGEYCDFDRVFGTYSTPKGVKKSEKRIGWLGAFRLVDGFEMTVYWEIEKIHAHGKQFSRSYSAPGGWWQDPARMQWMERKTVLRDLLCNWGPMKGSPKFKDDDDIVDAQVVEPHTTAFNREDYIKER